MANDNDNSPNGMDNLRETEDREENSQPDSQPRLLTSNRPPAILRHPNLVPTGRRETEEQSSPRRTPSATGGLLRPQDLRDLSTLDEGRGISSPPGAPTRGSPDDAGSVVIATPVPLTPGPHRRELGIAPVRLTPASNFTSPTSPGHADCILSSSPANDAHEPLVLWGTTVNMEDAERRLRTFIKEFRPEPADFHPVSVNGFKLNDATDLPAREANEGLVERIEEENNVGKRDNDAVSHYVDLLHQLAETGEAVLNVDMSHVQQHDPGLYQKVRTYPNELITVFDAVATSLFKEVFPDEARAIEDNKRRSLQVRTYNLLPNHVQSMRELNPSDISNLVAVKGMIIRASSIIPDIQVAMYSCSKCRTMTDVRISHGRIDEPRKCNACNTRDSFTLVHSRSTFSDKQMVRLQEAPESIPKGETPSTFTLVLYDSLVDTVKPGDRVEITGILRAIPVRVNPKLRVVRSVFRTYIDCVHVRLLNNSNSRLRHHQQLDDHNYPSGQQGSVQNGLSTTMNPNMRQRQNAREEFFESLSLHPRLYERLAGSLAPSIFGMDDEKKGVLLQLFGGSDKNRDYPLHTSARSGNSPDFRSSINILLVGDPGTSKSQLLQCAHRLSPRGVYTSGRGSSAVGLTAYVTKDPDSDDHVLESGALVLSDRGLCCIDEFDKMSDFTRSVLHEAMEQQTVSVAKAGIIATLNARTAVLAAANPVNSRYDTAKSVVDNIDLPPTLLSRFDLIYLVLDAPNADSDRELAQHIVSLFFRNYDDIQNGGKDQRVPRRLDDEADRRGGSSQRLNIPMHSDGDFFDAATLMDYIAYAREKVNPKISDPAAEALVNGYVDMRSKGRGTENISATPRQLESLIRLAEAHARMKLREEVEVSDVREAVRLVRSAIHMAAYDPITGRIDMNIFAAGRSRESSDHTEKIVKLIIDKLAERAESQDVQTSELLRTIRDASHINVTAGDLREALARLQQSESVVRTNGGKCVRLLRKN